MKGTSVGVCERWFAHNDEVLSGDVAVVHRDITVLAALMIVTSIAFAGTQWVAAGNRQMHRSDAAEWFERAQRALEDGRSADAVEALRKAALQDPGQRDYRLALASALVEEGAAAEARQVLLVLRNSQPEDPEVNLRLARLEARREGGLTDAIRYYQLAIGGLWRDGDLDARRQVRTELIRLMLDRGQRSRALSELLLLGVDLPDNAETATEVGELLLTAGDYQRALERFRDVLSEEPDHQRALAGAGEAAFELADYARARQYFAQVSVVDERISGMKTITDLVLTSDPLAARIGVAERRRRMIRIFEHAALTLEDCATPPPGETGNTLRHLDPLRVEVAAFAKVLRAPRTLQARDAVEEGLDLVYRVEQAVARTCGASALLDQALSRIGRLHGLDAS